MTDSLRKMKSFIRHMRIQDNSVILIKEGTDLAKKEMIDEIIQAMTGMKMKGVVMVVKEFDDVKFANTTEMAKNGWYRMTEMRRMIKAAQTGAAK